MSVSPEVFTKYLTLLCERFGRAAPSKPLTRVYYEHVAHAMTDAQFEQASRVLLATARWFPAPADFLTAGEQPADERARIVWAEIVDSVSQVKPMPAMSENTRRALSAIGGTWALRSDLHTGALRKGFIETFVALEHAERNDRVVAAALGNGEYRRLPEGEP